VRRRIYEPGHVSTPSTAATVPDRPRKRRLEILFGRYTLNPLIRMSFRLGFSPPRMVLVETVGRRTGQVRQTPAFGLRDGTALWLIAQHGAHAGWVKNFLAQPEVRVRIG
jgi:hypothetical protein